MKKTITFLLPGVLAFSSLLLKAQGASTTWAKGFGCGNNAYSDQVRSVTTDATGNAYFTGVFNLTTAFDTYSLTASGYDNMFVAKADAGGNIQWVSRSAKTAYVLDVAVDGSGNVYTTGYFSQSNSSPNAFGSYVMSNAGYEDGFITKCDPNGNFLWAKSFGGGNDDSGNALAVDGSGNIYVTGYFKNIASIGTQTITSSTGWGDQDAFLAKFDASGNTLWAKAYGGNKNDEALEICTDASGNVYTVGTFSNTAAFDTYTLTNTAVSGKRNVFITKTNSAGNVQWASKLDVNSGDYYYDGYDYSIVADAASNLFITGAFSGTATFGTYTYSTSSTFGDVDVFVAKLDAAGVVSWANRYGYNFNDRGVSITCDASGNAYTTGVYTSTVSFGGNTLTNGGSFVVKNSPSGSVVWAKGIGESGYSYTNATGIALDGSNDVILSGNFRYRIITDNDTLLTGASKKDGFIMKVNGGSTIGVKENEFEKAISLMPNPAQDHTTIMIEHNTPGKYSITVTDVCGRVIQETQQSDAVIDLNLENYSPGVYYIQVYNDKGNKAVKKLVKL